MCHSRRSSHRATGTPVAPSAPQDPGLRASDTDREATASFLRDHAAAGRLDPLELDERLGTALAARTLGDLAALRADLPGRPAVATRRQPAAAQGPDEPGRPWTGYLTTMAIVLVVWLATGADGSWPIWVAGPWGGLLLLKTLGHTAPSPHGHRRA